MSDVVITVEDPQIVIVVPPDPAPIVVEVGVPGPAGESGNDHINAMLDMDIGHLREGAIPVWDETEQKWVAQNYLADVLQDGGNF